METRAAQVRSTGLGIRIRNLRRVFDNGLIALEGLSLDIAPGEFVAILGPSGCGKSSLLRLIASLDAPQGGSVEILTEEENTAIKDHRFEFAYVFQDAHLLPWRNVLHNVALPLELAHMDRSHRLDAAQEAIARVGLSDAIDRFPNQLSGGMRMRVSLARALVTRPRLLLLDEPFAALDEITRQRLDEQLRELWTTDRMTVVFVTHSTAEAVFLAERAIVLSARPGRVIEDRRIELPGTRDGGTRATTQFANECRLLYQALERGGA